MSDWNASSPQEFESVMPVEEMTARFTNNGDYAGPGPLMAWGQEDKNGTSGTKMNYACHVQAVLEIVFSRQTPPFLTNIAKALVL